MSNAIVDALQPKAKSIAIASAGVKTAGDFANLMSALMSDLIEGKLTPAVGNAACNAAGKLLKIVEMNQRYGKGDGVDRDLMLSKGVSTSVGTGGSNT